MSDFSLGDKVLVHQSPVKCEVICQLNEHWIEVMSEDGKSAYRVPVQFAAPENSIALILTGKQAKDVLSILNRESLGFGVSDDVDDVIDKIQEVLSNV